MLQKKYYLDRNNNTNTVFHQTFCDELTILHYFNNLCDPIQKTQHLKKLSERFKLKENGWEYFNRFFRYEFLMKNK